MIATYVPPMRTVLSFEEARDCLRWAFGPAPMSTGELGLIMAQSALETGRWQKMWNWNWGNAKAGESYAGMFTCIPLNEVLHGRVVWFAPEGELVGGPGSALVGEPLPVPDGHPQTRMRAHANQWEGAQSHAELMQARFPLAYQALLTGDAARFVHALKTAGYFTADEAPYANTVAALQREFTAKLRGAPYEEVPVPDDLQEEVARLQRLWWATVGADGSEAVA